MDKFIACLCADKTHPERKEKVQEKGTIMVERASPTVRGGGIQDTMGDRATNSSWFVQNLPVVCTESPTSQKNPPIPAN